MILSTTHSLDGRAVLEYKGIVTGEAILGANIFKDMFAGIRDLVGGRSATYERELGRARKVGPRRDVPGRAGPGRQRRDRHRPGLRGARCQPGHADGHGQRNGGPHELRRARGRRLGVALGLIGLAVACRLEDDRAARTISGAPIGLPARLPAWGSDRRPQRRGAGRVPARAGGLRASLPPERGAGAVLQRHLLRLLSQYARGGRFGAAVPQLLRRGLEGRRPPVPLPPFMSPVVPAFGSGDDHRTTTRSALDGPRSRLPGDFGGAEVVSAQRNTLPLFGVGLFESVRDVTIMRLSDPDDLDGDGISGRFNTDFGATLGRFGVKAQSNSIEVFTRGPLQNQMGITSDPFLGPGGIVGAAHAPLQVSANPNDPTIDHDGVSDPEISRADLGDLIAFTRFLAPPRKRPFDASARRGEQRFEQLGCARCHVPFAALRARAGRGLHRPPAARHGARAGRRPGLRSAPVRPGLAPARARRVPDPAPVGRLAARALLARRARGHARAGDLDARGAKRRPRGTRSSRHLPRSGPS